MQIGTFAKVCGTKVSVLRHYDQQGLLPPDYIDRFTGYRYYRKEQIDIFLRIRALKKAGFTLPQIREILKSNPGDAEIIALFRQKKEELTEKLRCLTEAEKLLKEEEKMIRVYFMQHDDTIFARSEAIAEGGYASACEAIENELALQGYQRISPYSRHTDEEGTAAECRVLRLKAEETELIEDICLPFENDERIIGKWAVVGEFAVAEDFLQGTAPGHEWDGLHHLYFLPGGEHYWCFGWTKGFLLIDDGYGKTANEYTLCEHNGECCMLIRIKSYACRHGGQPAVLVLRQLDHTAYTAQQIARKDDIDKPFIPDEKVLGKWKAVAFCGNKDEFDPTAADEGELYFSFLHFLPDGEVISHYEGGKEIISGRDMQEWTKGYLLRKWNNSACAYEIREIGGREYLLIEWKSGDYRWGGFDTTYYVFARAE